MTTKLTVEARRVLQALAEGGHIEARKIVPYPHTIRLIVPGKLGIPAIHPNALDALIVNHLVDASPLDFPLCDKIDYTINDAGRAALTQPRTTKPEPLPDLFEAAS